MSVLLGVSLMSCVVYVSVLFRLCVVICVMMRLIYVCMFCGLCCMVVLSNVIFFV